MAKLFLPPQDCPVFSTREFASLYELSLSSASNRLRRLEEKKIIQSLTKGIWFQPENKGLSKYSAVPLLLGKEHGYVSFLTALNIHDIIEQIPSSVMVATTGYTRKLSTPLGTYEFIKLTPTMLQQGYEWSKSMQPYLIATPEKALLDTYYISTRKGRRIATLPEIDWKRINIVKLKKFLRTQVKQLSFRKAIESKLAINILD